MSKVKGTHVTDLMGKGEGDLRFTEMKKSNRIVDTGIKLFQEKKMVTVVRYCQR
jgi:hypothetical protein